VTPLEPLALIPAAFIAGILMFLAPCTLPIVPGYLAFISGNPTASTEKRTRRIFINALAFVIGFSIVFILLGTFAGAVGAVLGPWRDTLARVAGVLIILFGLTMLGVIRISVLQSEHRFRLPHFLTIGRFESSLLIGALFAMGWSPCIGPILGSILLLASGSSTAAYGAILLGVFSLGLGIPFLITALLIDKAGMLFAKSGKVANALSLLGGVLLIIIGIMMLLGNMGLFVEWGFKFLSGPYNALLQYM
jgi:cytochrome c-type biogenesis protein